MKKDKKFLNLHIRRVKVEAGDPADAAWQAFYNEQRLRF